MHGKLETGVRSRMYFFFKLQGVFVVVLKENNCSLFYVVLLSRIWYITLWVCQAVLLSYKCFCSLLCLTYNCIYLHLVMSLKCKCCGEGSGKHGQKQTRQLCCLRPLKTTSGHAVLGWNVSNTGSNM